MYTAFDGVNHPGRDGMRRALFPIRTVSRDLFRVRVSRASGSTVVPSPYSPTNGQEATISAVLARLPLRQPTPMVDIVHSSRARPTPCAPARSLGLPSHNPMGR